MCMVDVFRRCRSRPDRIESNIDKPKENTIQDISAQLKAQSHTDRDIKKKE